MDLETHLPTAVFRADATPHLGAGHMMRCLTLASKLQDLGWRCGFAVNAGAADIVPALRQSQTLLKLDEAPEDEPGALRHAWPQGVDCLVVDHYRRSASWETACRGWARVIMAIDDLADRPHDCDILLDQTYNRLSADYAALTPPNCQILTGSNFALLRPGFAAARRTSLASRAEKPKLRRLLVSLGATDPNNHTALVLQAIAESGITLEVDVVLGSGAPHLAEVRQRVEAMPQKAQLFVDASDMPDLMCRADLAIGAAGTSTWERCCLGLPTVLVVIAENQRSIAEAISRAGAAHLVAETGQTLSDGIKAALSELANDPTHLGTMSARAAEICDGRGCDRSGLALTSPGQTKDGRAVNLRLATVEDEALILEWQRHPTTRRYARNPAIPTEAEHHAWFIGHLTDPGSLLTIITVEGEPAGLLRLDPPATASASSHPGSREISILVDPGLRGQGVALQSLLFLRRWQGKAILAATVLPENTASKKLFQDAGYLPGAGGLLYSHPPLPAAIAL